MNKFKKISLLSLLAISTMFVGCNEDDNTGASTIMATPDVSGDITVPFAGVLNVNEADEETFNFSVTIDKPQVVDIHLRVAQTAGTAVAGEDFEIPTEIVIPAYATTASGTVKILDDCEVEGMEDFTIQISDVATSNAKIKAKTMSFTVNNTLSTDLELAFNFNKSFSISGTAYTLCAAPVSYDMDFLVYESDFVTDTGVYQAATGNCVEALTFNDAQFPVDGTYHIFYNIYDDGGLTGVYHDPFDIPIRVDYSRCGGIAPGSLVIEDAYMPTSLSGNGTEDYLMTVTRTAGVFTITNSLNEVIATGKSARTHRKATNMNSAARLAAKK